MINGIYGNQAYFLIDKLGKNVKLVHGCGLPEFQFAYCSIKINLKDPEICQKKIIYFLRLNYVY